MREFTLFEGEYAIKLAQGFVFPCEIRGCEPSANAVDAEDVSTSFSGSRLTFEYYNPDDDGVWRVVYEIEPR